LIKKGLAYVDDQSAEVIASQKERLLKLENYLLSAAAALMKTWTSSRGCVRENLLKAARY